MTTIHDVNREEVMALLDGELSGDRATAVRDHVDRCRECQTLEDELRRVSARLSTWQVGRPSDTVALPTEAPLAGAVTAPRSARSWLDRGMTMTWWAVATAAAILVVFMVGGNLWRSHRVFYDREALADADVPTAADQLTFQAPVGSGAAENNGALKKNLYEPSEAFKTVPAAAAPPVTSLQFQDTLRGGVASGQQLPQASLAAKESRMIVRTVTLSLSTDRFDDMRAAIDRVAAAHQGRIASLSANGEQPTHRSLSATVLVPVTETDAAVSGLRALGTVVQESQSSEDVTDSHRDLAIRLANARVEEGRLGDLLVRGTDKLADVLAVEQAQSRVRGEIEQMTAEEQAMAGRAVLSTITVQVEERYRAEITIGPTTLSTRFHNALVDGLRAAIDAVIDISLAFVGAAPALGLWGLLLFWPSRWAWRRIRRPRAG
jgi:hypothetical protein